MGTITILGLIESAAAFACYPLLSQPYQAHFGRRRDGDAGCNLCWIYRRSYHFEPSGRIFASVQIPLISVFMSRYGLMTVIRVRGAAATSFDVDRGRRVMTIIGIGNWQPMTHTDYGWMAILVRLGALGITVDQMFRSGRGAPAQPCLFGNWFAPNSIVLGETLFHVAVGHDCCVRRPVYLRGVRTTGLIPLAWLQSRRWSPRLINWRLQRCDVIALL